MTTAILAFSVANFFLLILLLLVVGALLNQVKALTAEYERLRQNGMKIVAEFIEADSKDHFIDDDRPIRRSH